MITLLEDNTILTPDENVNSGHPHKALTPLTKALAESFLYPAIIDADRPASALIYEAVRFDGRQIQVQTAQCDVSKKGRIFKSDRKVETLTVLDNLTSQPQRVQDFASFVFTVELRDEIQAEEEAAEVARIDAEEKKVAKAAAKKKEFDDAVAAEVTKQLAEHYATEH